MLVTIYKELKNSPDDSTHIKFKISFNKDNYHWATSSSKEKGYQVNATPITKSKSECGKFNTESFTAFSGFYEIILPANRQSKKRLEEAEKLLEEKIETIYKEWFSNRNYIY